MRKKYRGGWSSVTIENDVAIKQYRSHTVLGKKGVMPFAEIQRQFETELKALRLLKGEKYFPQLLDYDMEKMIIKMTSVGISFKQLPTEKYVFIVEDFEENFKDIYRTLIRSKIYYSDVKNANLCFDGENINLIDLNGVELNFEPRDSNGEKIDLLDFDETVSDLADLTKEKKKIAKERNRFLKKREKFFQKIYSILVWYNNKKIDK